MKKSSRPPHIVELIRGDDFDNFYSNFLKTQQEVQDRYKAKGWPSPNNVWRYASGSGLSEINYPDAYTAEIKARCVELEIILKDPDFIKELEKIRSARSIPYRFFRHKLLPGMVRVS